MKSKNHCGGTDMDSTSIINGPYLLAPTAKSLTLAWEMDQPGKMQVICYQEGQEVARVAGQSARESGCPAKEEGYCLYTAVLTGLHSCTAYKYAIAAGGRTLAEGSFKTLANMPEKIRLITMSDSHLFHTEKAFTAMVQQKQPDFILHGGDISFGTGYQHEQYVNNWFQKVPEVLRCTPAYYIPGNHDDGPFYEELFANPLAETVNSLDGGHTYSFDYGCTHFVMVDSNPWGLFEMNAVNSGIAADAATKKRIKAALDWLEQDLRSEAAQKAIWRVMVTHHPYTDVFNNRYIVPLAERCGVQLVISGHLHYYIKSISVDPQVGARTVYAAQGSTQEPEAECSGRCDEKRLLGDFPEVAAMGKNNYGQLEITPQSLEYKLYGFEEKGGEKLVDTIHLTPEAPSVKLSEIMLHRLDNNGRVEIQAVAENFGSGLASVTLPLWDNQTMHPLNLFGTEENSHVVLLEPGEKKKVTAIYTAVVQGEHVIRVLDTKLFLVVFEPVQLSYAHMKLFTGSGPEADCLTAGIEATNNLDREVFVPVPFYLNQRIAESRNVFFRGHEKKYIEFQYRFRQGGDYQVSIGDQLPKEITIAGGIRIVPRVHDKSGHGHWAWLHGTPKVIATADGAVVKLEEYGDYIEIPASPELECPTGFSGMVWAQVDRLARPQEMGHNPLMVRGKSVGWGATYFMRMVIERAGGLKWGTCHDITEYAWQGGHADLGNWMHYAMTFDKKQGGSSYCNGQEEAHVPGIAAKDTLRQWGKEPIFIGYSYIGHVIPELGRPKYFTHLPASVSQVRFYKAGLTKKENAAVYAHPGEKGPQEEELAVWLDFRDILTVGTHTTEWRHPAVYSQAFLAQKKYWKFKQLKVKAVLPLPAAMKAVVEVSDDGTSVKGSKKIVLKDGTQYIDLASLPAAQYLRIITEFSAEVGADGTFVPELQEYQVTAYNETDFTEMFWSTRPAWEKGTFTGAVGFAPRDRLREFPEYTDVIHG